MGDVPERPVTLVADLAQVLGGSLLLAAPHMDDEVLACGGTIALLPEKRAIHVAFATDGANSPAPRRVGSGGGARLLPEVRKQEAGEALGVLGVPPEHIHFLDFPDGRLKQCARAFRAAFAATVAAVEPSRVLLPFRYDRHPDHIALCRLGAPVVREVRPGAEILEYFVYPRWRLLPGSDVRQCIDPRLLVAVDIGSVAERKRQALECYRSQIASDYPWLHRPILSWELLERACSGPEYFLRTDALGARPVFVRHGRWIVLIHTIEPFLKTRKDRAVELLRDLAARALGRR